MNQHDPFINPPLPYSYNSLEPFIDAKTMELHHDRHLQTYVDNLNHILSDYPKLQNLSLEELIGYADSLPDSVKIPILRNAGGVYNHIFFFSILKNPSTEKPSQPLLQLIESVLITLRPILRMLLCPCSGQVTHGWLWTLLDISK